MTKATCTTCGGALFVTEDTYGYGSVLGCVACGRQPKEDGWQPVPYSRWEPMALRRAPTAVALTGSCIECKAAIGPRATRCNPCHKRGYDERRKVRTLARREGATP